jgi:hypothetical protein
LDSPAGADGARAASGEERTVELTTTQVSLIAAAIALAVLGRIAAHVTDPASRPDPFEAVPGDQWRRFQARVEAFASTSVIALRDSLLAAWERYRAAAAAAAAPDAEVRRKEADGHRAEVRELYADLISRVREELREDRDPWWRRLGTRRARGPAAG